MWNINSTLELLRALSLAVSAPELVQVVVNHMRETILVNTALVINRLNLDSPCYRIALHHRWDARQWRYVESQPNDTRRGGLLAPLLYAGEMRLITDLSIPPDDPASDLLLGHKALMAFPMFEKGHAAGAVILLTAEPPDIRVSELCGLAMMSGLLDRAIHTHSLLRQLETTCQALSRELAAAADVQRWLLPPRLPSASVAASYRTAKQSGGDYYDVAPLPDGKLGFLVADVCGKGAPAALLMAVVRTIAHLEHARAGGPAALLRDLNRNLCELDLLNHCVFVTAVCAALDRRNGRLVYSSAGHPAPRLVRADRRQVVGLSEAVSLPLGIDVEAPYREAETFLSPADTVVLYTDGIVEARSADGVFFGAERLDQTLRGLDPAASAQGTVQAVLDAVAAFSGPQEPSDDQTLVAVKH